MKETRKRWMSLLLTFVMLLGLVPAMETRAEAVNHPVYTRGQVEAKLLLMENTFRAGECVDTYKPWTGLPDTCFGFAKYAFEFVFEGTTLPTLQGVERAVFWDASTWTPLLESDSIKLVRNLSALDGNYDEGSLRQLLQDALPGDIVIASNGRTNHLMIFRGTFDENGDSIVDGAIVSAGNDCGDNLIYHNVSKSIWGYFLTYKSQAVSLYRYSNYMSCTHSHAIGAKENGVWNFETYKKDNGTFAARCKYCKTEIPVKDLGDADVGRYKANTNQQSVCSSPYDGTANEKSGLACLDKNIAYDVIGSVQNAYGTTWCKLADGNYINKSFLKDEQPLPSTLSINPARISYAISKGSICNVQGSITSNKIIQTVTAKIDNNGNPNWFHKTFNVGATSFNIGDPNGINSFRGAELSSGTHTLTITATDSEKTVSKEITIVVDAPTMETCAAPTFSTSDYVGGKAVTITSATPGATINYSYGGSSYSGAPPISFNLTGSASITATASKSGYYTSASNTAAVSVPQCAEPVIQMDQTAAGMRVALSSENNGEIYYALNGGTMQQYTAPLTLTSDATVTAYAQKSGMVTSARAVQTVRLSAPSTPELRLLSAATDVPVGTAINLAWSNDTIASGYRIKTYLNGSQYGEVLETTDNSASIAVDQAGAYTFTVSAVSGYAGSSSESKAVKVTAHAPLTVTFQTDNGTVLSAQEVRYGADAVAPTVPVKKGYTFTGWSRGFERVTKDLTIKAQYQINTYTVRFYNVDGKDLLGKQTVDYNSAISDAEIQSQVTLGAGYAFAGWHISQCDADSAQNLKQIDSDMSLVATKVWKNPSLPIETEILSATRNDQVTGYEIDVHLTCADSDSLKSTAQKVKVIAALKSDQDQLLATEMMTLNLSADDLAEPRTVSLFVSYDGSYLADRVEVSVVGVDGNDRTGGAVSETVSAVPTASNLWSGWMTADELEANGKSITDSNIQSKTEYRYQDSDRSLTTRTNTTGVVPTLEGYTFVSRDEGIWGAWSSESTSSISQQYHDDELVRQVQSRTEPGYTQYRYGRWQCSNGETSYCSAMCRYYGGSEPYVVYTDWMPSRYSVIPGGRWTCAWWGSGTHTHYGNPEIGSNGTPYWTGYSADGTNTMAGRYFWEETRNIPAKTLYKFRDKTITYTFEKWTEKEWSEWSETPVDAFSNTASRRDVETRMLYRYQTDSAASLGTITEERSIAGSISNVTEDLNGKLATVMVYKGTNSDPTEPQLEYVGQTTLTSGNEYSIEFRPKEDPTTSTGDFIIALALEGAGNVVNIGKVPAPAELYDVQFYDFDGNVLGEQQKIAMGKAAITPAAPEVEGYTFVGWDHDTQYITRNVDISPIYWPKEYSVVFVDHENETVQLVTNCEYGALLLAPEDYDPTFEGMSFKGWKVISNRTGNIITEDLVAYNAANKAEPLRITDDMIVIAQWEPKVFQVIFSDGNGGAVDVQTVSYGCSANPPVFSAVPENMVFLGWRTDVDWWSVTNDITVAPILLYEESASLFSNLPEYSVGTRECVVLTAGENATIYYTTDGSDPDPTHLPTDVTLEDSTIRVYDEPLEVSDTVYIQAMAVEPGKNNSEVIDIYFDYSPVEYHDTATAMAEIGVYSVVAEPQKEITLQVQLDDNPGLIAYLFTVECDRSVFYVDYDEETGLICVPGEVSSDGTLLCAPYGDTGWQILWFSERASTRDGSLFSLTLKTSEEAAFGTYPVTISYSPANTVTGESVEANPDSLSIAFSGDGNLKGDVNSDGYITTIDVVRIARYLIDDITFTKKQLAAADVTGDGKVTASDVIRLARYLVGLTELN